MGKFASQGSRSVLTRSSVLNPYNITKPSFPSSASSRKTALSLGAIVGIAVAGIFLLGAILAGTFLCRRRRAKKTAVTKATTVPDTKDQKPSRRKSAPEPTDNRRRSTRSTSAKPRDISHRSYSNHSKSSTATKTSQRTSHKEFDPIQQTKYEQEKALYKVEKAKYEKEKARVEGEVRRVVGEQLNAFRRSGYYDTPPGSRTVVPVIPAVELDAGFSLVGRHELSGGEHVMPRIEEGHELPAGDVELPAGDVELPVGEEEAAKTISGATSRAISAAGEEGVKAISRASSRTVPVVRGGVKIVSIVSSRSMPVTEEGAKAVSRASSRAMVLDRR